MSGPYVVDGERVYRGGTQRRVIGRVWLSPVRAPLVHVDWRQICFFVATRERGLDLLIALDTVATMYEAEAPDG